MAVIEVEGLRRSYGNVAAVRDVSFEVEAGEVVAVLGPNGAGKTTTVEILEGFRTRDAGRVSVLGTDPATGGRDLRLRVGVVLQECAIEPYLSVAEVLKKQSQYYPSPLPVADVLGLVGLEEKASARVKTLSGGQQRRLDVALGLIGNPELLFLDEPTTGFDPGARRQAWDVVKNLRTLGKTVLLTTHYMDEAQALADRVIVVVAGRVVASGTPESIGGRATAEAEIRFVLPNGLEAVELPLKAQTEADGSVLISSAKLTADLATLTNWALERGHELEGLTVTRPSLEDIYLSLTSTEVA